MPVWPASPVQETIISVDMDTLPVSLDNLKTQAGIPVQDTTKDSILTGYIQTATLLVGGQIGQDIYPTVRHDTYDFFPYEGMRIGNRPISSFTSIKYISSGVLTLLAETNYQQVPKTRSHNELHLYPIDSWPISDDQTPKAVQVDYTTGYDDIADISPIITNAILQVATALDANRGDCGNDAVMNTLISTTRMLKSGGLHGGRL